MLGRNEPRRGAWAGMVLRGRAGRARVRNTCSLFATCSATATHAVIGWWSRGVCLGLLRLFISRVAWGAARLDGCISSSNVTELSARVCLQRLVTPFSLSRDAPSCAQRRACALIASAGAIFMARFAAADYEALRLQARGVFASKIEEVRGSISSMQKAQRAAEQALDMCC